MFRASRTDVAFDRDLFGPEVTYCGTFAEAVRQLRAEHNGLWAVLP